MMEDYIVRATAAGGQMRAFAATTKNLVESGKSAWQYKPGCDCGTWKDTDSRGNQWEV